ncbi:TetR/AcrR family transcriptional regulator [Streptomyces sp. NPDC005538]|uniref:TetR/AcrR family transcriptional regulator n=1 Tax=unclassified Streptomyces TaxID=2593676 RepID=UPI0033BB23B2
MTGSEAEQHESVAAQPRARTRNARGQGRHLREELLDSANTLLMTLGTEEALSVRAVAKGAGVSANAVYLHFDSKEDLVLAVLRRLFDELAQARDAAERRASDAGGGLWEALVARSRAYVDWGIANPGPYRVLYEGQAINRLADPRAGAFGQPMLDRTEQIVGALERGGLIDPVGGVQRASLLLWTALHGIVSLRINKDTIDWPDPQRLAEEMIDAIMRRRPT